MLVVLLAGYLVIEIKLLGRGVPPENVRSFNSFLEWRPGAAQFYSIDNPPRLIAIGRREGLVVSGPAAYVLDETGKMTEWEVETGEGGPVTELLQGERVEMDQVGAKTWFMDRAR